MPKKSQFLSVVESNSSKMTSAQKKVLTTLTEHFNKGKVTTRQLKSCLTKATTPKTPRTASEYAKFVKAYAKKNPKTENLMKKAAAAWRAKKEKAK